MSAPTLRRLIEVYGLENLHRYSVTIVVPQLGTSDIEGDRELIQATLDEGSWDFLIESIEPTATGDPR